MSVTKFRSSILSQQVLSEFVALKTSIFHTYRYRHRYRTCNKANRPFLGFLILSLLKFMNNELKVQGKTLFL